MSNPYPEYKRNTIMLPVAEQPAQQEPVDKKGSPCPEFWDWLPKAYNFEGIGNFTKYNMEVAFLAGMQTTSPPASKPLTDEQAETAFKAWHYKHGNNTQGIKWVDDLLRSCWKAAIEAAHAKGDA